MGYQVFMHAARYFWMYMDADEEGCFSSHPTQTNTYIQWSAYGMMLGLTITYLNWGLMAPKSAQVNYFVPIVAFIFAIVSACLSSTSFTWNLSCGRRRRQGRQSLTQVLHLNNVQACTQPNPRDASNVPAIPCARELTQQKHVTAPVQRVH
jgi:hypothetical protein